MTIFVIAVAITFFLGLALVLLLVGSRSQLSARLTQLTGTQVVERPEERITTSASDTFLALVSNVIGPIRRTLGFSRDSKLIRRLALAGYREAEYTEIFFAAKLFAPVIAALVAGFVIRKDVFFWFVILSIVGILLPDLYLTQAIKSRRERIRLGLPDALDLLVICMEAGLGMDQALIRVGNELKLSHPEISDEFMLINLEQRAGKPRLEAWRNMADRTKLEIVKSFVNMLVQTERFGTPISRSLSTFADGLRTKRRQLAEEMAAKTTIKMIFPLVLFIFPSMFIVLLAPAFISISRNMSKFFQ
jgi:tight adherence protein C